MLLRERLPQYAFLMRLNKPIGILLLLWPTLWALWLAGQGHPHPKILFVFVMGVLLMRSAGCVINDFADRKLDAGVRRTRERPLASGKIKPKEALYLAALLGFAAFILVLQCNFLTIQLAFIGALLAVIYPLMKRFTHLPQFGLGAAFTWGVPMAFAAQTGFVDKSAWVLFFTGLIWPVIYDTMYAMVDREDDLNVGIKSTAILFGQNDILVIGLLQLLFVGALFFIGYLFQLHIVFYLSLMVVVLFFIYQLWLIKDRNPAKCFNAFLNNNWVGMMIFIGIGWSYWS